jgi:hypothetical protein
MVSIFITSRCMDFSIFYIVLVLFPVRPYSPWWVLVCSTVSLHLDLFPVRLYSTWWALSCSTGSFHLDLHTLYILHDIVSHFTFGLPLNQDRT